MSLLILFGGASSDGTPSVTGIVDLTSKARDPSLTAQKRDTDLTSKTRDISLTSKSRN